MKSWINKYQPKKLNQVIGQRTAVSQIYNFWRNFKKHPKNAILINGPPGSGKNCIIYTLAAQEGLEIVEINASDFRNKKQIKKILEPASRQFSVFGKKKIIFIDEVDGMSGRKDRGGVKEISNIIKSTKFPIFISANDVWSKKLKSLRRKTDIVNLKKINHRLITKRLREICQQEDIKFQELALRKLAISCDGDMRAAINDLQVMASDGEVNERDLIIWGREQEESIFNALKLIFKSFDGKVAKRVADDISKPDDLKFWLEQNIPIEYSGESMSKAFDVMSLSDIFKNRIMRWQHWRFLLYVRILESVGVQQAKKSTNKNIIQYKKPRMLLNMWRRSAKQRKARGLAKQIEGKLHCSARVLQKDFMPYLRFIKKKNKSMHKELARSLGI